MKNKVTVSRAHRLKTVPFKEIPDGTLCLNSSGITINDKPEVGISLKAGGALIRVSESYHLDYKIPSDGYVTFASFDDVCKWVANGCKLEDLQCDTKNEWEQLRTLELGDFFMEAGKTYQIQNFGLAKDCTTIECWCLDDSSMVEFNNERLAWPVRFDLGDTITFGKITE